MRTKLTTGFLLFLCIVPFAALASTTGTAVWRSGSSSIPLASEWNGASFGTAATTEDVGVWRIMAGAEAPTRAEVITLGVDDTGLITGMLRRGTSWLLFPFNPLSSVTEAFWWGFDAAYEQQSGRALLVWNNGSSGTRCVSYRIWNGSSWSLEDSITTPLSGEPKHMHLAVNPQSDEAVLVVSNDASQDYAIVWDGTGWGSSQILDSGSGDDRTDVYVGYEQQSGRALVVYGKDTTDVYYRIWNGSWGSESPIAMPGGVSGNVRWTRLASDPNSNNVLLGVLTSNADVWFAVWEGTAWGSAVGATTLANGTTFPNMDVAFENVSGMGMATYAEAASVRYLTWIDGMGWSGELAAGTLGNSTNSMVLDANPASDEIMLSVQDDGNALNCIRWSGSGWDLPAEQEANTGEIKNQPFIFVWDVGGQEVPGLNYYVSPSGDDLDNGLTPATAWKSLDNGDQLGLLVPGDTVNVLPGVYLISNAYVLTTPGTDLKPVVYRKLGAGRANVTALDGVGSVIGIQANNVVVDSINVTADVLTTMVGIQIDADSCTVGGCVVTSINADAVVVNGNRNLLVRNVIANSSGRGIFNEGAAENNRYYGNTVYSCVGNGIEIKTPVQTARIFNNISVSNDNGISGKSGNVCGFNDIWNNTSAGYEGGVADSAGGISVDPMFINPDGNNFHLRLGSLAIDSGLDLGYPFNGSSPDIGACEYAVRLPKEYFVSPTGSDDNDGLTPAAAWLSIDNGDRKGHLFPGDTVSVLAGTYSPTRTYVLTTNGTSQRKITYRGSGGWPVFNGSGAERTIIEVDAVNVVLEGLRPYNNPSAISGTAGIRVTGDSCEVSGCYVDSCGMYGISITGGRNLLLRNLVLDSKDTGVLNEPSGEFNVFHGNTVYNSGASGLVLIDGGTSRVFNNIIVQNNLNGVEASAFHVIGYNDVWGNTQLDYASDAADSAGGISENPLFVDPASEDFSLQPGSPCLDAGLDLGYPFLGSAPDMGAVESDHSDSTAYVIVTPETATVIEGTSQQYTAAGYNRDSLFVGDLTDSVAWSTDDPSGTVTAGGLYTAGHDLSPPDYHVIATYEALSDSGTVTVVTDGALSYVRVETVDGRAFPDTTLTTDNDTTRLYCRGYDSGDNPLGDQAVTWAVLGGDGIGGVSPMSGTSTILTLSDVGTGRIEAAYNVSIKDTSGVITCVAGEPAYIDVIPATALVIEESSYEFSAHSYDADSNFVSDSSGDCDWSTSDPSGSVSVTGLYTAGMNPSPPPYYVIATLGVFRDSSKVTVLSSGSLRYVRIEWPDATPVTDTTLTTDDDGTTFCCRAYDSADSLLGDAPAVWSIIGEDSVGSVAPGPDTFTKLTLSRIGMGRVTATYVGGVSDTTGLLTCLPGAPALLTISPDTATLSAGSTVQFSTATFDADRNPSTPVTISAWDILNGIGTISPTGLFNAETTGVGYVTCSGEGLSDTTGSIVVTPGRLTEISVMPDSVDVALGNTVAFEAQGVDAYGNATDVGDLAWDVIGDIGWIDISGIFTAESVGSGRVAATSSIDGVTDTNRVVTVLPNNLAMMFVTPDTASVRVTGTIQFTATGFDAGFEPAEVGQVTWEVLGGIGTIDADGNFLATATGVGYIAATSSIAGISDTTNMIVVEVPTVTAIPLGNSFIYADQTMATLLAFTLYNAFEGPETVESVTVRNASRGTGTTQEILSNIATLSLYVDGNGNRTLDQSDILLDETAGITGTVTMSFSPVMIGPGSSRTLFLSAAVCELPHDGDSLDFFLLPSVDIQMGGGTMVAGPDTLNSMGYGILDGMTARQLSLVPTGNATINPTAGLSHVLTIDIPRNGYDQDILRIFSIFNTGTADAADLDSLILFEDDGNGIWDGRGVESRLGALNFTGSQWQLSGLAADMTTETTRLYLAARPSASATNGATLAIGIPLHGLEMASGNDGPIDLAVIPVETIAISTSELLSVRAVGIPVRDIVPGETTGPVLGLEFVNGYASPVGIDGLRLALLASDPDGAAQQELDSQIGNVSLWIDNDGDYTVRSAGDSLIASAGMSDGLVVFDTGGLTVPASGGVMRIFIECSLDRYRAKNANTINFEVASPSDIDLAQWVDVTGDFPLTNPQDFTIDIFPASSVGVNTVYGNTLYGGEIDCLVFDFELPPNGYAADRLSSLLVTNKGSVVDTDALAAVRLWADSGSEGFDGDDILLGEFAEAADGWRISGLTYPIGGGHRFFVTINVASDDFEGGTVRFEIPVRGVEYQSGANGPDDLAVGNPLSHVVFPANSITVIPIPMEAARVYPGTIGVQVLTFALYNGYQDQTHTLSSVRLSNHSVSVSSPEYADYQLGQVSFYYDQNTNRIFDDDSLLASGYFTSGRLSLSGLGMVLHAESLSYFFIAADLPLDAIDSDSLAIAVEGHSDFTFDRTVNINGDFPVSRGGPLTIDGSVLRQYSPVPVGVRTLSPGETSVTLFAFQPAANGDQVDTLNTLTIGNLGDAGPDQITSLELWRDLNGDGRWQSSDVLLAEGVGSDSSWAFHDIGLEIKGQPETLLVVGDVAATAMPNSSFRAVIPVNGCQYVSANDGPVDAALISAETFVISTSGLKITYDPLRPKYTVGQTMEVVAHVTNLLPVSLDSVFCEITMVQGSGALGQDITRLGPRHLEAGATADFSTSYVTEEPGTVFWQMWAFSAGMAESSATVQTQLTTSQTSPTGVRVDLVSSIPTSVTRGQSQVFPLSLKYRHRDSSPLAASVRLDSLRLRIEDGSGLALPADLTFSRIVLATGYTNLAILESMPATAEVLLEFAQPTTLSPGDQLILSLQVDIDSLAQAGSFALAVEDPTAMRFVDDNTGILVTIDPAGEFPLRTAQCRITNPSHQLAVSYVPISPDVVNYGQQGVGLMQLILRHPGTPDDSQIQFAGLSFGFTDEEAGPIEVDKIFSEIKVMRQQAVIGLPTTSDPLTGLLTSRFSAPPVLSPGQTDTVRIEVTVRAQTTYTGFQLSIDDSTLFTLRDLSSGATIEAVTDPASSAQGSTFPMVSGLSRLKYPASPPEVCMTSRLPSSVIAGSDSLALVEISADYPSAFERSSVSLRSVQVSVLDTLGRALDPDRLFDRVGFRVPGEPVVYESSIELRTGQTIFHLGENGSVIDPGDRMTFVLVADIEPDVPFDHFVLEIHQEGCLDLVDATDLNHDPGFVEGPDCEGLFPFSTGPTEIFLPAGSPVVRVFSMPVQMAYPGQVGVTFLSGEIAYNRSAPQGDLVMKHWRGQILSRTPDGLVGVSGSEIFNSIHLLLDGEPVASDTSLTGDTLSIDIGPECVLPRGSVTPVALVCDLRPGARLGNYVMRFGDSTFVEFADRDLGTAIHGDIPGRGYPVLSAELTVGAGSLANSFVNWPNPFNPAKEVTNIGFILAEDAHVDIEVFTITGELVATITSGSLRSEGPHDDEDRWAGLNDAGRTVQPGTYLCRITARYVSGQGEEVTRKLAVIR